MVNLKKPAQNRRSANKRGSILNHLKLFLEDVFSGQQLNNPKLLVAFSGGLDSAVLLHGLHKLQAEVSFQLSAMHVHHGLSENADSWTKFCAETCAKLNIPLTVSKVEVDKKSGLGIEAAARIARYQSLSSVDIDFICLAHHQDDQAETLLLQLARGAGVKGLAGMARLDVERKLIRPLLCFSRNELEAYANQNLLHWVEDESNDDTQYDRNFMRQDILPLLSQRYPAIAQTLSRSARNLADASILLDDLAHIDAIEALEMIEKNQHINLTELNKLSTQRQANLIRWWLAQHEISMPSQQQLQQIQQQLLHAKSDAAVKIKVSDQLNLMCYQAHACLVKVSAEQMPINLLWQGEEIVVLPNQSRLFFTRQMGKGLAFQRGGSDLKLRIKNREGGERFKPDAGRPSRTLKYVLQASKMPPWQREQLPLIFMDETLVYIPNLGASADLQAKENEMGCVITWQQTTGSDHEP